MTAAYRAKLAACGCLAVAGVASAAGAGDIHTFVGCPVYRDTNQGRKSGCWLATENSTGLRFDISQSRTKPQLGRAVLVEGVALETADRPCGAPPLLPVQVSVLPQECARLLIPAEGLPGRPARVDPRKVLPPVDTTQRPPLPPFTSHTWSIEFSYSSDFLEYQYSEVILDEIARFVLAGHPRRVDITGYAITAPLSIDSVILRESPALARERADMVAEALRRLLVPEQLLKIHTGSNPAPNPSAQLSLANRRRVEIHVQF